MSKINVKRLVSLGNIATLRHELQDVHNTKIQWTLEMLESLDDVVLSEIEADLRETLRSLQKK